MERCHEIQAVPVIMRWYLGTRATNARHSLDPFLPGVPTVPLIAPVNAITNEFRLFPRNIMITRPDIRAVRIPDPFLRKKHDRVILGNLGSRLDVRSGYHGSYRCWNILSRPERQMPNLSRSGINFDKVRVISV